MTRQTIKDFVQDFKNTSYYNFMYNKPGVIMSYVAGSRLTKTDSLFSDFDVIIITESATDAVDTGIRFKYKNLFTVHFYYHTIDQFLMNNYTLSDNVRAIMQTCDLNRSELIYENPNYNSLITRFFKKKQTLSRISMLKYAKNFDSVLIEIATTNALDLKYYSKYLYKLCQCYYRIARIEQDTQLLLQAKCCANEGLTAESIEKIIEILKALKHIIDYYTMENLVAQFEPDRLYVLTGEANG